MKYVSIKILLDYSALVRRFGRLRLETKGTCSSLVHILCILQTDTV